MSRVIDLIEEKRMETKRKLHVPECLLGVGYIDRLLTRVAILEVFLEDAELDARFRIWTKRMNNLDRLERGLPQGDLEWQ